MIACLTGSDSPFISLSKAFKNSKIVRTSQSIFALEATAVFLSPLPVSPALAKITEKCWILQILKNGRTSHADFNKHMFGNDIVN